MGNDKTEPIQILLIEDSPTETALIKAVLANEQDANFDITEASSLKEAFSKMNRAFDIILLNMTLPGSRGIDTFQKMYEKAADTPIIVLASANSEEIAIDAVRIGAQDYIIKEHMENAQAVLSLCYKIEQKQAELKTKEDLGQDKFSGCILVAEDSLTNQLLAKILLKNVGLDVTIANNGKEVLEKIHSQQFDLILMDMQMPEMDGDEATRILRKEGLAIPIIACTANNMEDSGQKHLDIGYNDYLIKPFNCKELLKTIGKYLPKHNSSSTRFHS